MNINKPHRRATDKPPCPPPEGVTKEQLEFFSNHVQKVARRSAREAVRRFQKKAVTGFAILTAGLMLVVGGEAHITAQRHEDAKQQRAALVESGSAIAVSGCNGRYIDRVQVRAVLANMAKFVPDPATKERLTKARAGLTLPDCRKDQHIITDDPSKPIPDVRPFYPGAPYAPTEG